MPDAEDIAPTAAPGRRGRDMEVGVGVNEAVYAVRVLKRPRELVEFESSVGTHGDPQSGTPAAAVNRLAGRRSGAQSRGHQRPSPRGPPRRWGLVGTGLRLEALDRLANASVTKPRKFSTFRSQRTTMRRKFPSHANTRSTFQRRLYRRSERPSLVADDPAGAPPAGIARKTVRASLVSWDDVWRRTVTSSWPMGSIFGPPRRRRGG